MHIRGKLLERSVLVIDEDVYLARLIGSILESFEVGKVVIIHDFESAVEYLNVDKFDCIITDWLTESLKGLDLVAHIRHSKKSKNNQLPIVLCTGMTGYEQIISAMDAGVTEILAKPVVPNQLLKKLMSAFYDQREFISADDYTGPDRRRRSMPFRGHDRRGKYGLDQASIDSVMSENHHGAS